MIRKKTVLVLGAGASNPYGFPAGSDLYKSICHSSACAPLAHPDPLYEQIQQDEYTKFRSALSTSGRTSVDAFLERRTDLIPIGKDAIALALIPYEEPNALRPASSGASQKQDWYRHLFDAIDELPDRFAENRLAILTFNYDRSVEYFLTCALQSNYRLSRDDAWAALRAVPIIHLTGRSAVITTVRRNDGEIMARA